MRYHWIASPGNIVFKRVSNRWILILLVLVGLVAGGAGAWGISARAGLSPFVAIFLQAFFAIGALFVVMGVAGLTSGDRYDPHEIIFDGTRGLIRIRDASGPGVEIPFDDVRGFEVRVKSLHVSSQGTGRMSNVYHYFAVVQTEATTFEVVQSHSREEPDRAIAAMSACVAGSASATKGTCALPSSLTAESDGAAMKLRWRNAALRALILFTFAMTCMGFVMSRFVMLFALESTDNGFFYAVLGFIALVFVIIVASNLRKFVRDLRNVYELVVGPSGLRYAEYQASAPEGAARKVVTFAPDELARIWFEHQIGEQPIPIRARGHNAAAETIAIDVVALSATERMMVATWLRELSRAVAHAGV